MTPRKTAAAKASAAKPDPEEVEKDLNSAKEEDLTHFDEDDDPATLVGNLEENHPNRHLKEEI